jgi:hypothetical protein
MLHRLSLPTHCKTCKARYRLDIPEVSDNTCTPAELEKLVERLIHT